MMKDEYIGSGSSAKAQLRLRTQRLLMSVAMYCLSVIPITLSVYFGYTPNWVLMIWLVCAVSFNVAFMVAIRSGFSLRFKDPSMTLAQMIGAIMLALFAQMYGGPVRAGYLVVVLIIIVFGCLRLQPRQLLWVGVLTALAYGLTLPVAKVLDGERFNSSVELVLWTCFLVYLPCIAALGGHIGQLRKRVVNSNAQLQEALSKVTELATRDELTGLHNRRSMLERLEYERLRVERGGQSFCVCLLDLDHFKRVNDEFGHPAGDAVLSQFAVTAVPLLRSTDLLARYGGEEFLLLLPETTLETAQCCVARLQNELKQVAFPGLPAQLRITASVGIAHYQLPEVLSSLIERTDKALYLAKERGRDRIEVADPAPLSA